MKAKKFLAALLSAAMVLGTMAVPALADGAVISFSADTTLTETIVITEDTTINLNGYTITADGVRALWVKSGTVTINGGGTITSNNVADSSSSVIRVGDGVANNSAAKLTIGSGVTVSSGYCYGVTVFGRNTTGIEAVIDGTVSVSGEQAAVSGNGLSTLAATTMTINGTVRATHDYAIYHPGSGTLTVNSGATVEGPGGIEAKAGTVNINGGTITATAQTTNHTANSNGTSTSGYAVAAVKNNSYKGNTAITVTGGTITGPVGIETDNGSETQTSISISGGTFTSDVKEYLAEGYVEMLANDAYTVKSAGATDVAATACTVKTATSNGKYDQLTTKYENVSGNAITYTVNIDGVNYTNTYNYSNGVISGDVLFGLIVTGIPEGKTVTITSTVQ